MYIIQLEGKHKLDLAFLFLYRKIEHTSVFSSKNYISWAADVSGKIKPRMRGPQASRYMTALKKIQTWAAHVKKESLDGAAHNPADTCWPTDNK